jgi:hypothetical protein
VTKNILKLLQKCLEKETISVPGKARAILTAKGPIKYRDLKAACCVTNAVVENTVLKTVFPVSEIRSDRRTRLDEFFVRGDPPLTTKRKQKVLLLSGFQFHKCSSGRS